MLNMKLGCVVMASGGSTRFGSDKLMAAFGQKPLLAHTLERVAAFGFDRVLVVTRSQAAAALCRQMSLPCLMHSLPLQNDTVRLGIQQMKGMDGCMFCVADQPLCSLQSMRALAAAMAGSPQSICRLYWQNTPGNPILFPADLFEQLSRLPQNRGGGILAAEYPHRVIAVQAACLQELEDVDTPQQLCNLEKHKIIASI